MAVAVQKRGWGPGNGESAKSGINTTVCGPDAAHACQTSTGGQQYHMM